VGEIGCRGGAAGVKKEAERGLRRDNDPGELAGDLGALFRGGEEGKGEREALACGARWQVGESGP
jgi:hypothetical protein